MVNLTESICQRIDAGKVSLLLFNTSGIETWNRMFYVYPEKELHAHPGILRGTEEWNSIHKIRANIEKSINHFKESYCVVGRKTQDEETLHADLLLRGSPSGHCYCCG